MNTLYNFSYLNKGGEEGQEPGADLPGQGSKPPACQGRNSKLDR